MRTLFAVRSTTSVAFVNNDALHFDAARNAKRRFIESFCQQVCGASR
jgi:hypothetical protein